jgi:hypothetical protein
VAGVFFFLFFLLDSELQMDTVIFSYATLLRRQV